ncbi:hypothetical protein [Actinophytocola xanthii]|uniref:Uncharacterized protein n=1 Tax=Actinophytocola xanthii TaxID=1912961 RepID=A0A1Q8CRK5_9PSEU|nr:hypothetical protein [Actinophytocola xanthii]OLF16989.1 hypothetical protein BU204_13705 [Actinophytocola xanthii]
MNYRDPRYADLEQLVRRLRPRLFAMYGLDACTEREIFGWGMEFTHDADALLYLPSDSLTYYTESAETAVERYGRIGDFEIAWL